VLKSVKKTRERILKKLSRISKNTSFRRRSESLTRCRNKFGMTVVFLLCLVLTSCSLKYAEIINSEDKVPEFVFEDTKMVRYEDNKPSLEVTAGTLEQYKNSNETYGKDISFTSYNDEGNVETEGCCGIIYADSGKKLYELFDDINVYNAPEKMRFYASV